MMGLTSINDLSRQEEDGQEQGPHLLDSPLDSSMMNDDVFSSRDKNNENIENDSSSIFLQTDKNMKNEDINITLLAQNQKGVLLRGSTSFTPLRRRFPNGSGIVPERGWKSTPRRMTKAPARIPLTARSPPRLHRQDHGLSYRSRLLPLPSTPILQEPHVNDVRSNQKVQLVSEWKSYDSEEKFLRASPSKLVCQDSASHQKLSIRRVNSCPTLFNTTTLEKTKRRGFFRDDMDLNNSSEKFPSSCDINRNKEGSIKVSRSGDTTAATKDRIRELPKTQIEFVFASEHNANDALVRNNTKGEIKNNDHEDQIQRNDDPPSSEKEAAGDGHKYSPEDDASIVLDMISTELKIRTPLDVNFAIFTASNKEEQDQGLSPMSADAAEELAGVVLDTPVSGMTSNCETSGIMNLSSTSACSSSGNRFSVNSCSSEEIDGMIVIKNVETIILTGDGGSDEKDLLIGLFQRALSSCGSNIQQDDDCKSNLSDYSCSSSSSSSNCEADDEGTDAYEEEDKYPLGDTPPSIKVAVTSDSSPYSSSSCCDDGSSFTTTSNDDDDDDDNLTDDLSTPSHSTSSSKLYSSDREDGEDATLSNIQFGAGDGTPLKMSIPEHEESSNIGDHDTDEIGSASSSTSDYHKMDTATTPKSQFSGFSLAESTVLISNVTSKEEDSLDVGVRGKRQRSPIRLRNRGKTYPQHHGRTEKVDTECSCVIL